MAQIPPDAKTLSQSEIDQMLKKMEELAKQGARDQAQELLSQLNEMMNNLQMGQAQGQQQGEGQGSAMNEQLNKLGEMMRRQQELMDQTQKLDQYGEGGQEGEDGQGENGEGQQGQNGQGQNGQGQQPGQSFGSLQGRQGQLQRDLESMMKSLRDLGLDPGKAFGEAGKSMGQAESELGRGDGGEALADQSDALDALRRGGQGLMEQMQQAMGRDGGGTQPGQRQRGNSNDPLGRPRATTGPDFGQNTKVPDDIDIQRAREILDAIRKRLGGALSPDVERNYLERLLKFD
jgi:uncharacterized protein (TIGR02302 family)